jgi:hypothetical protein
MCRVDRCTFQNAATKFDQSITEAAICVIVPRCLIEARSRNVAVLQTSGQEATGNQCFDFTVTIEQYASGMPSIRHYTRLRGPSYESHQEVKFLLSATSKQARQYTAIMIGSWQILAGILDL